jgi:hypothetical protein
MGGLRRLGPSASDGTVLLHKISACLQQLEALVALLHRDAPQRLKLSERREPRKLGSIEFEVPAIGKPMQRTHLCIMMPPQLVVAA